MMFNQDQLVIVNDSWVSEHIGEAAIFKWYADVDIDNVDCVVEMIREDHVRVPIFSGDIWPISGRYVLVERIHEKATSKMFSECRRRRLDV